eukprot:jgi/Ulvmu1/4055/UM019_0032.1
MSAVSKAKLEKCQTREGFANNWIVPLTGTCSHRPGFFCYAMFCCYCASYTNRKDFLRGDMTRYQCCNGHWPCSGRMKEQSCPEFCLCMEVYCCFAQSVASTRWGIQDQLHIRNTKCDNCIIQTMIALQFLSCICNIVACLTQNSAIDQAADLVDLIADIVWCAVCGCMQTQVKIEMTENTRWTGAQPNHQPYAAPPQQQMAYMGQPPAQGYPAHAPQQQNMRPPQGYPAA